ncbi:MarR family winged helix-turn-helix transcriptional regulator [Chitinolyticbacter meiyuanensis]|uniref:MarR family winged helix-turn-helix transcriptional regulator n=1 Tax=Chitinolyticbacter meiyuanensis TaxID=682798 RepID=UPI0016522EB3|nr:MarR family transcriptional regulator [Chitinolyticbacter meiyuanensis]
MKTPDFSRRFGFIVNDVARLYGRRFDQLARAQLGVSRAQCRVMGALHLEPGLSQAQLAQRLDLTAMAVARITDRMEAAGWLRREPSAADRRVNLLYLNPPAEAALQRAMAIGDAMQQEALAGLDAAEQAQLLDLLGRARANLAALDRDGPLDHED